MLEILKPDILRRLTKRLGVKPPPGGPIGWLSNIVILVSSVDDLLRLSKTDQIIKDLSGSYGTRVTYWTVPKGKRWHLKVIHKASTASISIVRVGNAAGVTGPQLTVVGTAEVILFPPDLKLEENWTLEMIATGNVGDTAIGMKLLYEEEDAY